MTSGDQISLPPDPAALEAAAAAIAAKHQEADREKVTPPPAAAPPAAEQPSPATAFSPADDEANLAVTLPALIKLVALKLARSQPEGARSLAAQAARSAQAVAKQLAVMLRGRYSAQLPSLALLAAFADPFISDRLSKVLGGAPPPPPSPLRQVPADLGLEEDPEPSP